ncbi:MAG TPA: hypothetical protein VN231_07730 [Allosphingosinicella sp.]|nr:hypothetical protein [Allosphingosinicella sp.]
MRTRKIGERVTGTFRARRSDGTTVAVEEVTIMAEDPTLTGAIWKAPPLRYEVLRLAGGGGAVSEVGDDALLIDHSGERLTRC